jgi:hypothetical protein
MTTTAAGPTREAIYLVNIETMRRLGEHAIDLVREELTDSEIVRAAAAIGSDGPVSPSMAAVLEAAAALATVAAANLAVTAHLDRESYMRAARGAFDLAIRVRAAAR